MLGLSLSLSLGSQYYGGTPTPTPASAMTKLTALDSIAASPNIHMPGAIAYIEAPWIEGATLDPTKIAIATEDPGHGPTAGSTTTVPRTISATVPMRNEYPNGAVLMVTNAGGTLQAFIALDDIIYAGSTIVGVECAEGWYGASAAGSFSGATNASARAYEKPTGFAVNKPMELADAAGLDVEFAAFHRHGRNGRMVARTEFIGRDGVNTAPVQVSAATQLSTLQSKGHIFEVHAANVPVGALATGECNVNVKVYPWIGDASAVLDLSADGAAWPTAEPQQLLRFYNDRDGAYAGAFACTKIGAVGGTVQTDIATARTTPFPSINAAAMAVAAWNNSNRGHNDIGGGRIYCMDADGADAAHVITANITAAPGLTWLVIRPDPANAPSARVYYAGGATARSMPFMVDWGVDVQTSVTSQVFTCGAGAAGFVGMFAVSDCSVEFLASSTRPWVYAPTYLYQRNMTYTGAAMSVRQCGLADTGALNFQCPLAIGIELPPTLSCNVSVFVMAGVNGRVTVNNPSATQQSNDGAAIVNCELLGATSPLPIQFNSRTFTKGPTIVQVVSERAISLGGIPNTHIAADSANVDIKGGLLFYSTFVGERHNQGYTDDDILAGRIKEIVTRFSIFENFNVKSDNVSGTVPNRAGNWYILHHVGNLGLVCLNGSAGLDVPGDDANAWLGRVWPGPKRLAYAVGRAGVTFVDDKSNDVPNAIAGAGYGNYRLSGAANEAYDCVPAGLAMLGFDMDGNARRNDGTGAAGAFERPAA